MTTLPCPACGKQIPANGLDALRPGRQFIIGCPFCGYQVRGGVGACGGQQASGMSQQQNVQNCLMGTPPNSDMEDAAARAALPPVFLTGR